MSKLQDGTLTALHGEDAATALAADVRRFSELLPSGLIPSQTAVIDPATIAAVVSAIVAAGMLTAQIATLPGEPTPSPTPEVRDELTVLLQNSSGLLLVPVRHASDRGELLVAEPGAPLRGAAAARVVAITTGLAGTNLRLTLHIGDATQFAVLTLTLDRIPGDGDDRGWRFSEVATSQGEQLSLPSTGNRELVAVTFSAGLGELEFTLYLRGVQTNTGAVSLMLFDRTEPESRLTVSAPQREQGETPAQLVRILAENPGSGNQNRYLYDQDADEGGHVIARTLANPGDDRTVWRLALDPGGYISLQNNQTGRYLFRNSQNELVTDSAADGVRRLWRLNTNTFPDRAFAIRTSDRPPGGLRVDNGDDQRVTVGGETSWTLEDLTSEEMDALPIVLLQAKDRASDKVTPLVIWEDGENTVRIREIDRSDESQQWKVRFQKNGQALIQSVATRLFLATFDDGVLRTAGSEAGAARLWRIRTNNVGETTAIQSLPGKNVNLVDIFPGDPTGTRDIVNVAFNSTDSRQQWTFEPLVKA